ncbi:digestive organ expansion factor, partial [Tribonema minus]
EDSDFLSSIEVCIVDGADVMLMQNWEHVVTTLDKLNAQPKRDRGTDFSRVWPHLTHGQGRLWRQTVVLSAVADPAIAALTRDQCRNRAGAVRLTRVPGDGSICEVVTRVRQVFQRIPCGLREDPAAQDDARFNHFVGTVLPALLSAQHTYTPHTAVFVPSYYDYVRVRNELLRREQQSTGGALAVGAASAVFVCEYSRPSEIARSRAWFFQGRKPLLVYTGRAHYFNRFRVRGIRHLVLYGLPVQPQFYPELVNLIDEGDGDAPPSCLALFTPLEKLALQRVVGAERAKRMLSGEKQTFLFA